jgi:ankyrin repeat protein
MMAQYIDDPLVTKILISKGADAALKDNKGNQALHYAAILNKYENVKALVLAGSDLNYQA